MTTRRGTFYRIQCSADLRNWTILQMGTPGDDGILPFTDATPPAAKAFYRTIIP